MGIKHSKGMLTENPEDWHIPSSSSGSFGLTREQQKYLLAKSNSKKDLLTIPASHSCSRDLADDSICTEPEPEGEMNSTQAAILVKQLEELVTQIESSDTQAIIVLNEQIRNMEHERIEQEKEQAKLREHLAKIEHDQERVVERDFFVKQHEILKQDQESLKEKVHNLAKAEKVHSELSDAIHSLNQQLAKLQTSVQRLPAIEKERTELANTVSSLHEQITTVEATSTARALESANTLQRLAAQYRDLFQMVQEKQQKLARLAAQESVPFDIYQANKAQYHALQDNFESYQVWSKEQIGTLEAKLRTQEGQHQVQLDSDAQRLEAVEKERNQLSQNISKLQDQIETMHSSHTSQAVESAIVLERLAKQYKDIFHVVQEKQQLLIGLAAQEAKIKDGDDNQAAQDRQQELQSDFESYKLNTDEMLSSLQAALESQARDFQAKLLAETQRLAAVEQERSELSRLVETLSQQLSSLQSMQITTAEQNATLKEQLGTQEQTIEKLMDDKAKALEHLAAQDATLKQQLGTQEQNIKELMIEKEQALEGLAAQNRMLQERLGAQEQAIQEVTLEKEQALERMASQETILQYRLGAHEQTIQELTADKEQALDRIAAQDAMLQERVGAQEQTIQELSAEKEQALERIVAHDAMLQERLRTQEQSLQELRAEKEQAVERMAAQDAKLQERLRTQEEAIQQLMSEKEQASERLAAQDAMLQERVPLEDFQEIQTQYRRLQHELETYRADAKVAALEDKSVQTQPSDDFWFKSSQAKPQTETPRLTPPSPSLRTLDDVSPRHSFTEDGNGQRVYSPFPPPAQMTSGSMKAPFGPPHQRLGPQRNYANTRRGSMGHVVANRLSGSMTISKSVWP